MLFFEELEPKNHEETFVEPAWQLAENWFLEFNFLAFVRQGVALCFCSLDHGLQVTIARVWEMTLSSAKENVF